MLIFYANLARGQLTGSPLSQYCQSVPVITVPICTQYLPGFNGNRCWSGLVVAGVWVIHKHSDAIHRPETGISLRPGPGKCM